MLTTAEAAPLVGLSPSTLARRCAEGEVLGAEKKGKTWLIPEASLSFIVPRRRRGSVRPSQPPVGGIGEE